MSTLLLLTGSVCVALAATALLACVPLTPAVEPKSFEMKPLNDDDIDDLWDVVYTDEGRVWV